MLRFRALINIGLLVALAGSAVAHVDPEQSGTQTGAQGGTRVSRPATVISRPARAVRPNTSRDSAGLIRPARSSPQSAARGNTGTPDPNGTGGDPNRIGGNGTNGQPSSDLPPPPSNAGRAGQGTNDNVTRNVRPSRGSQVTVTRLIPSAPSDFAGSSSGESVRLIWTDNSSNETGFVIERQTRIDDRWQGYTTLRADANAGAFTDHPGVGVHAYRLAATNGAASSGFTDWLMVRVRQVDDVGGNPGGDSGGDNGGGGDGGGGGGGGGNGGDSGQPLAGPIPPSDVEVLDLTNGRLVISWLDNSNDEEGFELEREPAFGRVVRLRANETNYLDVGAGTTVRPRYRVRAFTGTRYSSFSDWGSPSDPTGLRAPTNLTVFQVAGGTEVRLQWRDNSGNETAFRVERQSRAGSTWSPSAMLTAPANETSMADNPGIGDFRYRVFATEGETTSVGSNWAEVSVSSGLPPAPVPNAPTGLVVEEAGDRRTRVRWIDNSDNEERFDIERNPAFALGVVTVGRDQTSYTDNSGPGRFAYRVRAANASQSSGWTGWGPIEIAETAPTAPSNLQAFDRGDESHVVLSWRDNSDNETAFAWERQTQFNGDWGPSVFGTASSDTVTYTDAPGPGVHRYQLRARNGAGTSAAVGWALVTVVSEWTELRPSADSRLIYCSTSGNDNNPGTLALPVKTPVKAYSMTRENMPDWVLFKKGDVFTDPWPRSWRRSGRSTTEMHVVTSYGEGPRPKFRDVGGAGGMIVIGERIDHFAVVGLEMEGGANGSPWAGIWLGFTGDNILIEDCKISHFQLGINVDGVMKNNVRLRRNVLTKNFPGFGGHSQGLLAGNVNGFLIEGNVMHRSGTRQDNRSDATPFNHAMYLAGGLSNVTIRRNIVLEASSNGISHNGTGIIEDNLVARCALGILCRTAPTITRNNVVIEGGDINPSVLRGFGIVVGDQYYNAGGTALVENNIVANRMTSNPQAAVTFNGKEAATHLGLAIQFQNNIVYNWNGYDLYIGGSTNDDYSRVTVQNNTFEASGAGLLFYSRIPSLDRSKFIFGSNRYRSELSNTFQFQHLFRTLDQFRTEIGETNPVTYTERFRDPARSLATYQASLGRTASYEAFVERVLQQSKTNWQPEYTAQAINEYFRRGFERVP